MSELTERLDAIQKRIDAATPGAVTITPSDVAYLLDLARKQRAEIDAVRELAAAWHMRGENDMAYSKAIEDEDVSMALLTNGADMVENARHIWNALKAKP